jgi:hypothetical protein
MPDITLLDMKEGGRQRLTVYSSTVPTGSARVTLMDSTAMFGVNKLLDTPVKRVSVTIYHNQAGFLDASRSIDGITWRVYSHVAVSAPAANTISGAVHYIVEHFSNWKLEWVNGGVSQTIWEPELVVYETRMPTE